MHSEYSYRNLLAAPAKLNAAWEFIEAGISNESCSTVSFGTCISLHVLGVIVPMATIPNSMRPPRNRTVLDMQKGERARWRNSQLPFCLPGVLPASGNSSPPTSPQNTRGLTLKPVCRCLIWCETRLDEPMAVAPIHVAAYAEEMQ